MTALLLYLLIINAAGFCLKSANKAVAHVGCIAVTQFLLMKFFTCFRLGCNSKNFRYKTGTLYDYFIGWIIQQNFHFLPDHHSPLL